VPPRLGRSEGGRVQDREETRAGGCSSCLVGHRNQDRKLVYLRTVETNGYNVTALDSPARGIFTARRITFQYILLCRPRPRSPPVMKTPVYVTSGCVVMSRYIIRARVRTETRGRINGGSLDLSSCAYCCLMREACESSVPARCHAAPIQMVGP